MHRIVLALAGALAVAAGRTAEAQTPKLAPTPSTPQPAPTLAHVPTLSVHPREMATATRTEHAGWQTLDGTSLAPTHPWWLDGERKHNPAAWRFFPEPCCFTSYVGADSGFDADSVHIRMNPGWLPAIYVPPSCVGSHRCPLLIFISEGELFYTRLANQRGMIVASLGRPALYPGDSAAAFDRDLRRVLRAFAVDPARIAIAGGWSGLAYGLANPAVFSQAIHVGHQRILDLPATGASTPELLLGGPVATELNGFSEVGNVAQVQQLRRRGYRVTYSFQFRPHARTEEEYAFWGQWLQDRWATHRHALDTLGEPPLLTVDVIRRMTSVWRQFQLLPDSIRTTARQALDREVLLPLGKEPISTYMVDMPALAAKYPAVAALFQAAQVTPQAHERYRGALLSAYAYLQLRDQERVLLGMGPSSALVHNVELFQAHPDELVALAATGMWRTP